MKAIVTKSCKGQPTGKIVIEGNPSDVWVLVKEHMVFYPYWDFSLKWIFDEEVKSVI